MHLNQLYGYFGRSRNLINSVIVNNDVLKNILITRVVDSIFKIKDNLFLVLFSANLNWNLIKHLNNENINVKDEFNTFYNNINKNCKI